MYHVYLDKMLCPIAPSSLELKISNQNDTVQLINEGEVNLLKKAGLTEISFELLLPNQKYPFAIYKDGYKSAKYFLDYIEKLKTSQKPFQFIVTRTFPNGKMIFDTNMKVSLEEYSIKEDKEDGFDVIVEIELKQYRDYGTKICNVSFTKTKATIINNRTSNKEVAKTYTVKKGDCLWAVAKKLYGKGSRYTDIYNANKDKVANPSLIYPGQVLKIP